MSVFAKQFDKDGDGNVDAEELDAVFGDAAAGFMKIFDSPVDVVLESDRAWPPPHPQPF